MLSQEIRRRFLQFFKEKGHTIVPSSSVVPHDDPTLLFINAGMNQFKDVFLGKSKRDYKTAATAQKCIRVGGKHNDLDNVGHTARHLTFFEMLGNFSFNAYFKEQAIAYAWEVSTELFGFNPEMIRITIFEEDEEAFELWKKIVPEKRITRMGEKDNFWAMGDTGPCGPCSELYFDRGEKYSAAPSPKEDEEGKRYIEFWNLVFMQFNRDASGAFNPLPTKAIDTGAGLERILALKIGADTLFGIDIFQSLIEKIEEVSGKKYDAHNAHLAPAFHVIADHIRSLSFAIADGAQPSNVERGYVLRKLLRRAVRYGRMLGLERPFLALLVPRLVEIMGSDYSELTAATHRITEILTLEEEGFIRTLKRGGNILSSVIDKAQKSPLKQISGEDAFKLKDTYGFPIEEVLLIAKDSGLAVNLDAYQLLEEKAKETSRSAQDIPLQEMEQNLFSDFAAKHGACAFTGYETLEEEASIMGIVCQGRFVDLLEEGQEGMILLNKTPFYPEKGGQVGDTGELSHHKAHFTVTACHSPFTDVIVHIGKLTKGALLLGEPVVAKVNKEQRGLIAHNHTATHLLHWALEQVLGAHIKQAGSLVESSRLRFDFNHHKPLTPQEIRQIEDLVNDKIRTNASVSTYEISYEEAQKKSGIKQFFGEKYGARVRVVDVDFSKELCGGTHVRALGDIGLFRIYKEGSIASGVRRIEAFTGKAAEEFMHHNEELAQNAAALLKATLAALPSKVAMLLEEHRELNQQFKLIKRIQLKQTAVELAKMAQKVGTFSLITAEVPYEGEELALLAEEMATPSRVVLLANKGEEKCQLLLRVASDLVAKGISAVSLIKELAPLIGGGGGGKAESAQAGGKNGKGIEQAFTKIVQLLSSP